MSDLLERLERKREGYEAEAALHRLYMDAYSGGGGFSGAQVQLTHTAWGIGASAYDILGTYDPEAVGQHTYLDRFQREDDDKFRRRVLAAHYSNYIKPITDLKLSYVLRKDFAVEGRPDELAEWRNDTDGHGGDWNHFRRICALRSATLGWCPVVVDMPLAPRDEEGRQITMTRADSNALGLLPSTIALFPANILDWQTDDNGAFEWVKIRTTHTVQAGPLAPKVVVTRYTIWWVDRFSVYEAYEAETSGEQVAAPVEEDVPHEFGRVPVAVLRHLPSPDDPVKGVPMHGQESFEARAHFNRMSELEEHLRSQVFAVLVLAQPENEESGEVVIGNDNALSLDPMATQKHYYMQPEASVATTYEARLENTTEEIYRQARVQFARPTSSKAAISGIARKFEFAQTDRALADFAVQIARWEEVVDQLVGVALGLSIDLLMKEKVTPPTTFDVEDMQGDLDLAISAIKELGIGPTATEALRVRTVSSLVPNLTDEQKDDVQSEIEELTSEEAREKQLMIEAQQSAFEEEDDEDEGPPPKGNGPVADA